MNRNHRPTRRAVQLAIATSVRNGDASLLSTARLLGVSVRSLQRHLAAMGTSHSEMVATARIKRACHLLAQSQARIGDIAARLGFANASSFSRTFMRCMKIQPRVYRRRQRSGPQRQPAYR